MGIQVRKQAGKQPRCNPPYIFTYKLAGWSSSSLPRLYRGGRGAQSATLTTTMAANGKIWCLIKKYVIGTLITALLTGIGLTAYHIITSDAINAQQTAIDKEIKTGLARLDDKIDSTQPAKVALQIQTLEVNQSRLEAKIDYNEKVRREQHESLILRQDKMYEILLEMKKNK